MRHSASLIVLMTLCVAGCSSPKSDTAALLSDADAIVVSHSSDSISIENKFPARLLGVRIELTVSESPQPYILVVPAIERDAKADVQISNFKTDAADVAVDPASLHPTQVTVRARDTYGKPHEVTVPWAP